MSAAGQHCSDLLIVRILADEASAEELSLIHAHAGQCDRCKADLDEALLARQRFKQHVFPRTLAAVESRHVRRKHWRRFMPLLFAIPALAALALVVVNRPFSRADEPTYQSKGAGSLKAFGRRGERVFPVEDGARLSEGDQLRFAVQPGSARFVAIGSVDGSGRATLYYPSTRVDAPGLLPDSILLDAAPGPERIFAVFSESRLDTDRLERSLATLGASGADAIRHTRLLPLPFAQSSLLIEKSPRR
jgi:hypothetical protein